MRLYYLIPVSIWGLLLSLGAPATVAAEANAYRIAILDDDLPGWPRRLAQELETVLRARSLDVRRQGIEILLEKGRLAKSGCDLLILPISSRLPGKGFAAVEQHLRAGGDIVALGAPAFTEPLWKIGDSWQTRRSWRQALSLVRPEKVIFDFESGDVNTWQRHSARPSSRSRQMLGKGPEGRTLHVEIENLHGWDTLESPPIDTPFPPGHSLTCLLARGSETTRSLSLEWKEEDGSRWIAVFPVGSDWRPVVLRPGDFKYWESTPGRGGPGDHLRLDKARQLTVGLAWTHTGLRAGRCEYAVDRIGTAPDRLGSPPPGMFDPPPRIEGLGPGYKFYSMHDVQRLRPRDAAILPQRDWPIPQTMRAHHPRPTGSGFNKARAWRWIPLLEALGSAGQWRGAPASLTVDFSGRNAGSARAAFAVEGESWYRGGFVQETIADTVERMARGLYLIEAGSGRYTYWPDEEIVIGARVANLSRVDAEAVALVMELRPRRDGPYVECLRRTFELDAGKTETIRGRLSLPERGDVFDLRTRLFYNGRLVDSVPQELALYRADPPEERRFVTVRDGDFVVDGKKWYVHGVNYMPSTGIAIEDQETFEYWLGARSYDAEFIQRDLERCRDMGLNSISIFIYRRSLEAGNLLDIVRRCDALDLKVNLSLRPGTPMHYRPADWEDVVRAQRLQQIDTIYAYDIAWEPFFGDVDERRAYDPLWRRWIDACYGSVAKAEEIWGVPAPRHRDEVSTPEASQLRRDGPHRRMVADYRRFVDDLVDERYRAAADRLRALDPNHLISFRMTLTGDPTYDGSHKMPYDFPGVAHCMDFFAPEGYGRIGDWDRIRPGMFTVSWARHCAPDKPVLWAEAGVSAWDRGAECASAQLLDSQGKFYDAFYKMVLRSHSNGVVWWWYPGGFRVNENSDFGLIHPDGTDRPATRVVRRRAAELLAERKIPEPDLWIDIDRDADARGLFGIYQRVGERYWKAIDEGHTPGLRTRSEKPARSCPFVDR